MPYGYAFCVLYIGAATALSWRPLRRSGFLGNLSFQAAVVLNEAPIIGIIALAGFTGLAWSQNSLHGAVWILVGLAGLIGLVLLAILVRGVLDAQTIAASLASRLGTLPEVDWARHALLPFVRRRLSVKRTGNVSYGPAGRRNSLDVYRRRVEAAADAPVFVHFHGGRFRHGRKNSQALSLLYDLAARGWVCISANYRLQPHATYLEQVADAESVLAWVRANDSAWAMDASRVVLGGTSAGANIAAYVGLDPEQRVAAIIGLGGYYGPADDTGSAPKNRIDRYSPPVLILHGDDDTLVPIVYVRSFVAALEAGMSNQVVFAELPRTQHAFDFWGSPRFAAVTAGIVTFLDEVTTPAVTGNE